MDKWKDSELEKMKVLYISSGVVVIIELLTRWAGTGKLGSFLRVMVRFREG